MMISLVSIRMASVTSSSPTSYIRCGEEQQRKFGDFQEEENSHIVIVRHLLRQACFLMIFHAILRQILNYRFCAISSQAGVSNIPYDPVIHDLTYEVIIFTLKLWFKESRTILLKLTILFPASGSNRSPGGGHHSRCVRLCASSF